MYSKYKGMIAFSFLNVGCKVKQWKTVMCFQAFISQLSINLIILMWVCLKCNSLHTMILVSKSHFKENNINWEFIIIKISNFNIGQSVFNYNLSIDYYFQWHNCNVGLHTMIDHLNCFWENTTLVAKWLMKQVVCYSGHFVYGP